LLGISMYPVSHEYSTSENVELHVLSDPSSMFTF